MPKPSVATETARVGGRQHCCGRTTPVWNFARMRLHEIAPDCTQEVFTLRSTKPHEIARDHAMQTRSVQTTVMDFRFKLGQGAVWLGRYYMGSWPFVQVFLLGPNQAAKFDCPR